MSLNPAAADASVDPGRAAGAGGAVREPVEDRAEA